MRYTKWGYIASQLSHPVKLFRLADRNPDSEEDKFFVADAIACAREAAERRGDEPGDVHLAAAQMGNARHIFLFVSMYLSGWSIKSSKWITKWCPRPLLRLIVAHNRLTAWGA